MLSLSLVLEYVAIDKRTLVGNIGLALALSLSGTYQPWLAQYLGHWKPFNWAIFSQMITIFAIPFLLPESCRWLISKGEKEKTVKILRRIARTNKKDVPEEVYQSVEKLCEEQNKNKSDFYFYFKKMSSLLSFRTNYTYLDLLKTPAMRRVSVLCIILFMVISCVFDTTVRNIANLNFEFYLSFMISAAMELPADLRSIVGMNWFGRRWSSALSLLLCAVTMVVCAFAKGPQNRIKLISGN